MGRWFLAPRPARRGACSPWSSLQLVLGSSALHRISGHPGHRLGWGEGLGGCENRDGVLVIEERVC